MLLIVYHTYDRLNMFRALLCPSSGAHDYSADSHGPSGSWVVVGWKLGTGRLGTCPGCSPDTYPLPTLWATPVL